MSVDPRLLIAREPMHRRQVLAVLTVAACTAAEGFDVYSVSFASPGIATAWNIDRALLGVVLSMELVGMGIGAFLLGSLADRLGRRPTLVACLAMMASGMWWASLASSVATLAMVRLYTGLGIGGMLATGSAVVAEYANDRRRSLAITLMIGGYSAGAMLGGEIVSALLGQSQRWQSVFELGALVTVALVVPALLFMPESIAFLCERQPRGALERVNQILTSQGRSPVEALPARTTRELGAGRETLFGRATRGTTAALAVAFFAYMLSLYFLMKWMPKLVVDMGHPASSAARVLVWANRVRVRTEPSRPCESRDRCHARRAAHQRRQLRLLLDRGAVVSVRAPSQRNRVRHRRRPGRLCPRPDRRGLALRSGVVRSRGFGGNGVRLPGRGRVARSPESVERPGAGARYA